MNIVNTNVKQVPVDQLLQHPDNPRKGNIEAIVESIKTNGFYGAVVVQQSTNRILVGNHRWQAAKEAGLQKVPTIFVDVDDKQARKIMLADNKTSDISVYDDTVLAKILGEIATDLDGTGWTSDELDDLLARTTPAPDLDAGAPRGLGNPVIAAQVIFDTEEEQQVWFEFVRWLRGRYPEVETNAGRIVAYLREVLDGSDGSR